MLKEEKKKLPYSGIRFFGQKKPRYICIQMMGREKCGEVKEQDPKLNTSRVCCGLGMYGGQWNGLTGVLL